MTTTTNKPKLSSWPTVEEILSRVPSDESKVIQDGHSGKIRIRKMRKIEPLPEMYRNETDLKKMAAKLLVMVHRCELFKTDNGALRVRGGVRVRSREPGMTDQHLCIRGLFVALEAKMPGKDLDPKLKQPEYRDKVKRGEGIHITYHSLYELVEEMKKRRLLSRKFEFIIQGDDVRIINRG